MTNRVALITGASSGIGSSTARAFASEGVRVVLAARREDLLAKLAAEITEAGGDATHVRADVAVATDAERMVAHAIETYGRLDFAVNNAGVEGAFAPIVDMPEEEFDRVLAINLKGTFLAMKYEARAMLEGGHGGAIVNVGSVNSFLGFAGGAAYATSKHGQVALTSSVSAELAPQGIRVNLVCPGVTDTPMHRRVRGVIGDDAFDGMIERRVHQQRAAHPDEIAATIVFLCSDRASYVTGSTLLADGGMTLTV
ncbi:MAG: glucose 1-dehydrogenase [Gemmatimonadetes bacterium]|nr:glucose 1-dehydrogenase [Gemmatimonadota bacterium]